jgi:Flp pilus assembly protein TadB
VGVDGEKPPAGHGELSVRSMWIVAVLVGGLYAFSAIVRGHVAAGLVGGALAAILCFLVVRSLYERRRRRRGRL